MSWQNQVFKVCYVTRCIRLLHQGLLHIYTCMHVLEAHLSCYLNVVSLSFMETLLSGANCHKGLLQHQLFLHALPICEDILWPTSLQLLIHTIKMLHTKNSPLLKLTRQWLPFERMTYFEKHMLFLLQENVRRSHELQQTL